MIVINQNGGIFAVGGALRFLNRRPLLRNLRHGKVTNNLRVSHWIILMHFFCLMVTLKVHILANILWCRIIHWTLGLITNAAAVCCYWCEVAMCKVGAAGAFTEMSAWWWLLITETCSKLYIIEYIVVFWLNDFFVIHRIGYFSEEKNAENKRPEKIFILPVNHFYWPTKCTRLYKT